MMRIWVQLLMPYSSVESSKDKDKVSGLARCTIRSSIAAFQSQKDQNPISSEPSRDFIRLTKCTFCNMGLNSTNIRTGSQGTLKKIGYSCLNCNIHYDKKLYTVNEKLYTDSHDTKSSKRSSNWPQNSKSPMLRPGFEPGICDSKGRNAWPDCAAFIATTPPELQLEYFIDIIKSFLFVNSIIEFVFSSMFFESIISLCLANPAPDRFCDNKEYLSICTLISKYWVRDWNLHK